MPIKKRNVIGIFLLIGLVILVGGVISFNMYQDNVEKQIQEGAKEHAVKFFKEKNNQEFEITETEILTTSMATVTVYGYLDGDKETKHYVTFYHDKTEDGYNYEQAYSGEVTDVKEAEE